MNYILENDNLKLTFKSKGAELIGIYNKDNNREYIWQGNPEYWNRSAPVLFPNVGKYNDGKYIYNDITYQQGQHGFARDKEFLLLNKTENRIVFSLSFDDDTLKVYPFKFQLIISYVLDSNKVIVSYDILNLDNKTMYFQIGGHPGFNVPFGGMEKRSDNYLFFPNCEQLINSKVSPKGYLSERKEVIDLVDGYLKISDDLFDDDALVIENQEIKEVSICDSNKKPYVTLKMTCPLFGIWSTKNCAPLVCIEPWYGRCDKENYDSTLDKRDFEYKLEQEEKFLVSYEIIIS